MGTDWSPGSGLNRPAGRWVSHSSGQPLVTNGFGRFINKNPILLSDLLPSLAVTNGARVQR